MKYNLVSYQSDNKENPGFYATKPLRGARGRGDDTLILQIFPSQESTYWQSNLGKVAREAAKAYYKSPGSITNALRGAVEQLNRMLRAQNSGLRLDKTPETASMMVAVLREGVLYLAQAGKASALLVSGAGTQLFYDEEVEQRGLGLTDLFELRFFRTDFFGADFLLMGLPQAMKIFDRESPTPNSVIRLVNETAELTSAFSLTKIGLGEGDVENRLLSLAMLLDEPTPESPAEDLAPESPASETEFVEESPEASIETPDMPAQLELPIDETPVAEEEKEAESELPESEQASSDYEAGLDEEIITEHDLELDPSDVIIDLPGTIEGQTDASDFVDEIKVEVKESMPEEVLVEEALLTEESADKFVGERVLEAKVDEDDEEGEGEDQVKETVSAYHDDKHLAQDHQQPDLEEPHEQTDPLEEALIKEPDAAALARQERLERLKQGALVGIARGAGWLRGVEENAQVTARRAEQKANAVGQEVPSLSPFAKWAIVFIVPLIVVAIAVSIYFARGLNRQYAYFVNQARAEMKSVSELTDPGQQRQAWVHAIVWLNQAREFNQGDTRETIDLRNQAQAGLDQMDGVKRIVFQNAFGKTIYPDLDISHLVPSQQAIFALDKNSGRVLRFYKAGDSYLPDNKFVCGPGLYGEIEMGPIVDITDIPGGPNNALVMGIDATGKVIYCSDSGKDQIVVQLTPPEIGFGSINSIHFGNDGLYLLDASNNKIWVYRGLMDQFPNEPGSYFGSVQLDLSGAKDIVVRREGLFILYDDGRMVFGDVPVYDGFVDASEQGPQPQTIQGHFTQISGLPVADNRLYYLEPTEPAIGRYSYRLVFNDVLKVSFGDFATPSGAATALAVSSSQTAFLAFGGQLFYAQLP